MDRFAPFPPHVTTMGPGQQHPHNQTIIQVLPDVKPRLTKDQHDILESHFAANSKPSTSAKKAIADSMGVPLDKINNWFQNRRAKVKQELKKQMNAYSLLQAQLPVGHAFVPSTCSTTNLFDPSSSISVGEFHHDGVVLPAHSDSSSQQAHAFAAAHQAYNPMVPTILESTQPGSSQGIVDNLKAAGYPMQDASGANADCSFVFDQQVFSTDFSADSQYILSNPFGQFSGPFMDVPTFSEISYQSYAGNNASPGQSVDCKSSVSPASPKSSTAALSISADTSSMPTLTATLTPADWSDDKNSTTVKDEHSPRDPLDTTVFDNSNSNSNSCSSSSSNNSHNGHENVPQSLINGAWSSAAASGELFAPSPAMFMNHNPSLPTLVSLENGEHDGSLMVDPHDLPTEAFMRRNSSTTALAESMNAVDIHNQSVGESVQRPASQATSLAARRQRPRPAALGAAALRSSSYSAGMPVSPGAANLTAPEQALRRIRSSGISNNSRVQKCAPGSGQRSPRNPSFADAAVRHASTTSTVSSPSVSASGSNLAPPTPLTPGEYTARFPQAFWQFHGVVKPNATNMDKMNANGVAVSWAGDNASLLGSSVSPPSTPLDTEQMLQYRNYLMQQQARLRYTPPQSAPATQQTFSTTAMMPEGPAFGGSSSLGSKVMHLRRPSLPEGQDDGMDAQAQWPVLPMFPANGEVQSSESTQQIGMGVAGSEHRSSNEVPRSVQAHTTQFAMSMAGQPAIVKSDFSVHEYTPPQSVGGPVSPPRGNEIPKTFHFSHAGPRDFEA